MPQTDAAAKHANRRNFSRKELLNHLKILGPITNPLPATLPPSPPPSRSASPAPSGSSGSAKRKRDSSESAPSPRETVAKRSRPSPDVGVNSPHLAPPTPPSEDSDSLRSIPVKRPRVGRQTGSYQPIVDKFTEQGRRFKHSADARVGVYYRSDSTGFVQLRNKPPPESPYASKDRVMASLESLDGVLCFGYAQWYKEYQTRRPERHWWSNATAYFDQAKGNFMEGFTNHGPREEALLGIFSLMDAYWRSRHALWIFQYTVKNGLGSAIAESKRSPAREPHTRSPSANPSTSSSATLQPTPPSTGLSPAANHSSATASSNTPQSIAAPPGAPTIVLPEDLTQATFKATELLMKGQESLFSAAKRINLPILEAHFPRTFARISKSTLKVFEEYEIDFDDDDSELFWPLAPSQENGLGWVFALGRSLLREYGGPIGYKGIDGIVRSEDIIRPNRR